MTTLCKRPPLPKKRKKINTKNSIEVKDGGFQNEFLEIEATKIKCRTQQNIGSMHPSDIYNHHQTQIPQTLQPKSANLATSAVQKGQKREKRGLLREWKESEATTILQQSKSGFIASFNSTNSFNSSLSANKRRIIRIRSDKSLAKPLFQDSSQTGLEKKLIILKEENVFYKKVLVDSTARLVESQKQLTKSIDKTKAEQRKFEKHIHLLESKIGKRQKGCLRSTPIASQGQFLAAFSQLSQFKY